MDHSFLSFAYIDVGTGSMILQATLASLFAVIVFSRQLRDRCKSYFKRGKKTQSDNE